MIVKSLETLDQDVQHSTGETKEKLPGEEVNVSSEQANLCLMADLPLEEDDSDEVKLPYHELQDAFEELFNESSILSTEYNNLQKKFQSYQKILNK